MALTTIEIEITQGTLSDNINSAYATNNITNTNFKSLVVVVDDSGTKRVLITYNAS